MNTTTQQHSRERCAILCVSKQGALSSEYSLSPRSTQAKSVHIVRRCKRLVLDGLPVWVVPSPRDADDTRKHDQTPLQKTCHSVTEWGKRTPWRGQGRSPAAHPRPQSQTSSASKRCSVEPTRTTQCDMHVSARSAARLAARTKSSTMRSTTSLHTQSAKSV